MIRLIHNTNPFIKTPNTMKKHNMLTVGALAAAMLFSACNKEMNAPADSTGGGQDVVEGIPTYAKVEITQRASSGTYAGDAGDYVHGNSPASEEERRINSAYVLIFDKMGVLERTQQLTADGEGKVFSATFPITTGVKKCFAVANVPLKDNEDQDTEFGKILTEFAKGTPYKLDAVRSAILQIASIKEATDTDERKGFYMGNVYKLGAMDEETHTIEKATEDEVTAEDGPKNNITIYIGRMVSKVTPKFTATAATQIGGALTDLKYRVRNNPKRFYLFPVYVKDGEEDKKVDVLSSPYFGISQYDWTQPQDQYPTTLTLGSFFSNNHSEDGQTEDETRFATFDDASYLTENSPKTPLRRKATMLSICGKWTPNNDQILNAEGVATNAPLTGANQGTFCRVQIIGAAEDANKGLILGYLPGVYDVTDPNSITVAWKETIGDEENKIEMENGAGKDQGTLDGAAVTYKAVKYDKGICYYGYWMKQNINGASVAQQYAIKRNNHYNVSISSVDGPGDPTEDDVLNKPDEIEADSYMKAIIEVLNWNVVDIEGGI